MKTLPNITALRFFLALFVVLYHIPSFCFNRKMPFFDSLAIFHKGAEAVYMFFSLSGFLIIRQLYIEKWETKTILLKQFFARRILRIFPLYYLILIFGFIYYLYILPYFGYHFESKYDIGKAILFSVFIFPNVTAVLYQPGGIIEILWSIGIEEQFYLFIAPILFLIPTKKTVAFLGLFSILYFVLFFSGKGLFFQNFLMYFFYFSFSGLCAVLVIQHPVLFKFTSVRNLIVFVFLLYFTTSLFSEYLDSMFYHLFSMVLFSVFICSLVQKPIVILENKYFVYLGKISYGIYMFHAIMMQIAGLIYIKYVSKLNLSTLFSVLYFNFFVILVTILIAHLSYKYYESYFLNLKQKFRIDGDKAIQKLKL
jgi:peptidoglycan/LPS O-acetylase OafA/YrhL